MHIYFLGIGGSGLSPLAQLAQDADYDVSGSDAQESHNTEILEKRGIYLFTSNQLAGMSELHARQPIDWVVATSAAPNEHPELVYAKEHNIRVSKRAEFLNELLKAKGLEMLAVAGTHGKTTTTAMLVWACKQLVIPASYLVGTNLSFGPSAEYAQGSRYFIYEADEFDRNFLEYRPGASLVTTIDYDHPDTYPDPADYYAAFRRFIEQSDSTYVWQSSANRIPNTETLSNLTVVDDTADVSSIKLAGEHNRRNAFLALQLLKGLFPARDESEIIEALSSYPGSERRMEQLGENLYTDYAHHPVEIAATLQLARELSEDVVVAYQPHQNLRQYEVRDQYRECFAQAKKVYWLPTHLTREDESLSVLTPEELTGNISNAEVELADLDDNLVAKINAHRENGELVLLMGAGSIDAWARNQL